MSRHNTQMTRVRRSIPAAVALGLLVTVMLPVAAADPVVVENYECGPDDGPELGLVVVGWNPPYVYARYDHKICTGSDLCSPSPPWPCLHDPADGRRILVNVP